MIVIIGAGLAGLICAKELIAAGQQVLLLESETHVGGRVRTEVTEDGYRLDAGFQVLFTAYPAVKRHLNLEALKPRHFDPGAILVKDGKRYEIADPIRQPGQLVSGLLNPLIPLSDKLRVLKLARQVTSLSTAAIFAGEGEPQGQDESIEDYLKRLGFTGHGFIDNFVRPFYGGILLDRSLASSARIFQFTFKMLATGETIIPAEGMQRIPEQLAASLPKNTLRFHSHVRELIVEEDSVRGVVLSGGETIAADHVVIATDSATAANLTGLDLPAKPMGSVCLYFTSDESLYQQKKILLNANNDAFVNNAVQITNIAPTYAPPHKHLLSVTVLDNPQQRDAVLAEHALFELGQWFPDHNLARWKFLKAFHIPFSQFAQPPGIYDRLPVNRTPIKGLFLAGEYTKSSSIQGAMHSGEDAAKTIIQTIHHPA
jgi:phytoene dehydrogenase-like protein